MEDIYIGFDEYFFSGIFMINIYITYRKRVISDHPIYLVEDKWTFLLSTREAMISIS